MGFITGFLVVAVVILVIFVTYYRTAFLAYKLALDEAQGQRNRVWSAMGRLVDAKSDYERKLIMTEFVTREQAAQKTGGRPV